MRGVQLPAQFMALLDRFNDTCSLLRGLLGSAPLADMGALLPVPLWPQTRATPPTIMVLNSMRDRWPSPFVRLPMLCTMSFMVRILLCL